jgi:hypothetical protein
MMSSGVSSVSGRGTPQPAVEGNASTTAARHQKEDQPSARTIAELALSSAVPCAITARQFVGNPQPIAFVKQANISNGPQQVNNGIAKHPPTRVGIPADQSNELLGLNHEQRLDIGATGAAGRTDRKLETVGAILRSED